MRKRIAALLLLALFACLWAGCQKEPANAGFLPESHNDELLVVLPEDWQWLEDWQTADDVPRLALAFDGNEECLEPLRFGSSWGYYTNAAKEEITSYIACGVHPLEAQADLPQPAAGAETVRLVWQAEPSETNVVAYAYDLWQQRTCGNTVPDEILHTEIALAEDGSFSLLADEHSYVYVIDAKWQDAENAPGLGGSSEWAFYVE